MTIKVEREVSFEGSQEGAPEGSPEGSQGVAPENSLEGVQVGVQENSQEGTKQGKKMSRRKMLAALGVMGIAASVNGIKFPQVAEAATTLTPNLKLAKSDPFVLADMNANFDRVDSYLGGASVSPDFYKVGSGVDDTDAVQAAFDSGKPVIFTRDYNVKSVEITGAHKKIDFNGYWLTGISESTDTVSMKDCILKITGFYLRLYNIQIAGGFNTNYKCAVHWYSKVGSPAQNNQVYGMQINRTLVGLHFGSYLDDPAPYDAPQSENFIIGLNCRSVQNCLVLNQPNGFLKIIGGILDCGPFEWPGAPYDAAAAYCFYNKQTELSIVSTELLKTTSTDGFAFKGSNFSLLDCVIEAASTWGVITGDAYIHQVLGGFQGGASQPLFTIESGAVGRLYLEKLRTHRGSGAGSSSTAAIITGLSGAPNYKIRIEKSRFEEWKPNYIAASNRDRVHVEDSRFLFTISSALQTVTVDDQQDQTNLAFNVDTTGESMSTAATINPNTGWIWTPVYGTGANYVKKNTADVPSGFLSCIEMHAIGVGYITSARFLVPSGAEAAFQAWAKYSSGGSQVGVKILWFKANGTAASTVETLMLGAGEISTTQWTLVTKAVTVPVDAVFACFRLTAEVGSLYITGLQLRPAGQLPYSNAFINNINRAFDVAGEGFILKAPDNTRYKISVTNAGALTTVAIT
ncbi:hypothetical protein [Paenibacillus eucommiae]|uniref:CBM-cenC domain-containing protein n=1 Tax=Paenibacillus eucommiae TaxID=1355755 RepID=A0ABS4J1T8_9BACL|nr:hypothetical protein [Paenibacillus eucommiae]MBP1993748.1 hypothetical protein [Paenibacillus eucommiae]